MTDTSKGQEVAAIISAEEKKLEHRILMIAAALVFVIGGGAVALAYFGVSSSRVYIEKAAIEAPSVSLTAPAPGVLRALYVSEGQTIAPNTVVAQVGESLIKSTSGGLVISAEDKIGENVAAGEAVVMTIDPAALKVVGQIEENKGLNRVSVGDRVAFTVDAFGGKTYEARVSEVAPTSHESGIAFNISSQRATQEFDIKAVFDTAAHPELKNGMSARMWVYPQ